MGALAGKERVSLKELASHTLRAESPEAEPREDGEDTGTSSSASKNGTCCPPQQSLATFACMRRRRVSQGTSARVSRVQKQARMSSAMLQRC